MQAQHASGDCGIDTVAFANLLREPLAASRALLELLAGAENPDPGMIGGYLGPALRELRRACELLEDLHVLHDAGHAVAETDERRRLDVHELVENAGYETTRRGEMLPPPELASRHDDTAGSPHVVGHQRTLDRMVRNAIEFASELSAPDARDPVPITIDIAADAELGSVVRLALGQIRADHAEPRRDEADHFRRSVLATIAVDQGGRAVFGEAAAPAVIRIDLPVAPAHQEADAEGWAA